MLLNQVIADKSKYLINKFVKNVLKFLARDFKDFNKVKINDGFVKH